MKSIDQIIGYIEGRLSVLNHFDPPMAVASELERLLTYIKGDENNNDKK